MINKSTRNDFASVKHPKPYLIPAAPQWDAASKLKIKTVDNPLPNGTLGDVGLATSIKGPVEFPLTILIQPFDSRKTIGIDTATIRTFRWDSKSGALFPFWNSGINIKMGFIWSKIQHPGIYVPIGLPRDRLIQNMLQTMTKERIYSTAINSEETILHITQSAIRPFLETPDDDLEELRLLLTIFEAQTGVGPFSTNEIRLGRGGHLLPFPLPQDVSIEAFKRRLSELKPSPRYGVPEEALFNIPERFTDEKVPWILPMRPRPDAWPQIEEDVLERMKIWKSNSQRPEAIQIPAWLFSRNWWMYHHDTRHTGHASGISNITSTSVGSMLLNPPVPVPLDGTIVTIPSIVNGKIYIGTYNAPVVGGTLYKIDLYTGVIEATFSVTQRSPAYAQGIGGSPAIVNGRVYFSNVPGRVYCVDAASLSLIWVTDLRNADPLHNQPVNNNFGGYNAADCFSSPLVVNGKVYVGSGEGERDVFGFVFCLDANTGNVQWLYCTNQFNLASDNSPNVIPASTAVSDPLPPWASGFTINPDPPHRGASVWSSCAYDWILNRIYVGTGNSRPDDPLPDEKYASGVISLDASTGTFKGFFQPDPADSYRVSDLDVDVPAPPTIVYRLGDRVVAFGSKNGSFFLLDPDTMLAVARRQLLPKIGGNGGFPGDTGALIDGVDPHDDFPENKWGVMGSAAVHPLLGRLFVGLGGYDGIGDYQTTPFMRVLDWNNLHDAWTTSNVPDDISRYTVPRPPMYTTPFEAGLSSPAVVNDVVFVSTSKPALYALDAVSGLCLWAAPTIPGSLGYTYVLGPAIYGNYVVIGAGNSVYIYSLPTITLPYRPLDLYASWWDIIKHWPFPPPPPPPPPDPILRENVPKMAFGGET
jgi:outer membrane protein assembly factor BamB